jgi:predicted metalloprotease with PDZ domain
MKKLMVITLLLFTAGMVSAQAKYEISVDLLKVKKDRVKVVVNTPEVKEESIDYVMPAVIPGTYSQKDYGRFVSKFRAYTKSGKKMTAVASGLNVHTISNATQLGRIEYLVDDTWDAVEDNFVFQPGGTNIDKGKNFVINHQGFYGYLEGYKMLPYEVSYKKPENLYGSTPLRMDRNGSVDVAYAANYVTLVDNPIMFCVPDTASLKAGNMTVHVSLYSQTGKVKADTIRDWLKPMAKALEQFFGTLPVDDYHFILYFPTFGNKVARHGGFGALEHSYGSFYFLPEMSLKRMKSTVLGVASHEFLHILTPLNIHSEEIEYFDFRNPKMSAHLWMYEGCTEYFSHLVQVSEELYTYTDFIKEMNAKIRNAKKYIDDNEGEIVSFTEMSRGIITKEYKDLYGNVYEKGALIGFLIDIRLKELSNGEGGLRDMMMELADIYGPSVPFKDDELIDVIVNLTYPEMRQFFDDHVIGNQPLPYVEYLDKIGWDFFVEKELEEWTYGKVRFGVTVEDKVQVRGLSRKYNPLQLVMDDIIISIDGEHVDGEHTMPLELFTEVKTNKEVSVVVERAGGRLTLKSEPMKRTMKKKLVIVEQKTPTEAQLKLRMDLLKHIK